MSLKNCGSLDDPTNCLHIAELQLKEADIKVQSFMSSVHVLRSKVRELKYPYKALKLMLEFGTERLLEESMKAIGDCKRCGRSGHVAHDCTASRDNIRQYQLLSVQGSRPLLRRVSFEQGWY